MSRKTMLVGVVLGLALNVSQVYATEIRAGSMELSGGSNASLSFGDTDRIQLSLTSLYYLQSNFGIGLYLDYDSTQIEGADRSSMSVGPTMAYGFSVSDKAVVRMTSRLTTVSSDSDGRSQSGLGWALGGQYNHFLADNLAVNAGLEYRSVAYDDTDTTDVHTAVGVSIYFLKPSSTTTRHSKAVQTSSSLDKKETTSINGTNDRLPRQPSMPQMRR